MQEKIIRRTRQRKEITWNGKEKNKRQFTKGRDNYQV